MGAANKSVFFKVAESISSKFIRCNNNYISKNPSSGFRFIPTHQHYEQHTNNNKKLLLSRSVTSKPFDVSSRFYYFSMLCPDNNGRRFSLGKHFSLRNHGLKDHLFASHFGGSCNGILCFEDEPFLGNVILWNPITDELKSLPPSFHLCHPEADQTHFRCSGFGFDPRSQDYKVVRLVQNFFSHDNGKHKNATNHYELYSLKTDSWRPIDNPKINSWYSNPIYLSEFWEGRHYQMPICLEGSCYWYSWDCVLSFNFADEVFSSFNFPYVADLVDYSLLDFDGSLGCVVSSSFGDRNRFDLFVWNNASWSQVDSFVVDVDSEPLGFWGRDKCFLDGKNKELLLFDLTTRELKPLGIKDDLGMYMFSFVESTVSIIGDSKVGELHTEERKEESGNNEGSSNDITTDEASNFG